MGFLNIMGGIAAGAQRADELEAKLEASKTKSDPAQKLVQKIMETGYTTSEDFTNQGLKISDLQKMSVGGLFGVYGKAVKYAKDQETYSTNIKSNRDAEGAGDMAYIHDGKFMQVLSPVNYLKKFNAEDKELTQTNALPVLNYYIAQLSDVVRFHGGFDKVPEHVLDSYMKNTFQELERRNISENWSTKADYTDELFESKLAPFLKGNKSTKASNFREQLKKLSILGGSGKAVNSTSVSPNRANSPKVTHITTGNEEFPADVQPFLNADNQQNTNNSSTNDGNDGKIGLKSLKGLATRLINNEGNSKDIANFLNAMDNLTSNAKEDMGNASDFKMLSSLYHRLKVPKPKRQTYVVDGVTQERIVPVVRTKAQKDLADKENTAAIKLSKTQSIIGNTTRQVTDINRLYSRMGVLTLTVAANKGKELEKGTTERALFEIILDGIKVANPQASTLQEAGISATDFYNRGLALLAAHDELEEEERLQLRRLGASYLASAPAATSLRFENIINTVKGLFSLGSQIFTRDNLASRKRMILNPNDLDPEQEKKLNRLFYNNKGLQQEEENYRNALERVNEHSSDVTSVAYLRAQAAAALSFSKIQLAYTYAAVSQGGEGSARTISDADFQNNLNALFSSQGEGLVGVMQDIDTQMKIELAANEEIQKFAGTTKMNQFSNFIRKYGLEKQARAKTLARQIRATNALTFSERKNNQVEKPVTEEVTGQPLEKAFGSSLTASATPPANRSFPIYDDGGEPTNEIGKYTIRFVNSSPDRERDFYGQYEQFRTAIIKRLGQKFLSMANSPIVRTKGDLDTVEAQNKLFNLMFDSSYGDIDQHNPFHNLEVNDLSGNLRFDPTTGGSFPANNLHSVLEKAQLAFERHGDDLTKYTRSERIAYSIIEDLFKDMATDIQKNLPARTK